MSEAGHRTSSGGTGWGSAHGAVSILNATATGIGCSLAVEAGVEALWTWTHGPGALEGAPDNRLVDAVRRAIDPALNAKVSVRATFPPARGLKTSSSAAAAMTLAALKAKGLHLRPMELIAHSVAASKAAGVTLTGAFDDQAAVVLGGCQLTDNTAGRILRSLAVPRWDVAIWVPQEAVPKAQVAPIDTASVRDGVASLPGLVEDGRIPEAMTRNGRAFTRLYQQAGLAIDDRAARAALEAGALGAGLSGTGPAVAALFNRRAFLPDVPGGRWMWTHPVAAPAQAVRL